MSEEAKAILDRWATVVCKKNAVFIQDGKPQINQKLAEYYKPEKYSEDICVWIPPKNCIRLEFEDTPENNKKWINMLISNAKCIGEGMDYCVTYHEGGKSAYFNMFNFSNIPLNEDNSNAKNIFIEMLLPPEARASLDRTNLGWTLSPVIGHHHWKPKYNGSIHAIVDGKNPLEHKNKLPEKVLRKLATSKKNNLKVTKSYSESGWGADFLLNYCTNFALPTGQRHSIIEKNLMALIIHRHDKDQIKAQYCNVQNQPINGLSGWEKAILNGNYTNVSLSELRRYITENNIPYEIKREPEISDSVGVETKVEILTLLKCGDRAKATEIISKQIKDGNYIYTTRNDEKEEVWIYSEGIYVPEGKTFIREQCREVLGEAYSNLTANEVIAKIETDTYIESEKFFSDNQKYNLAVQNGILNVKDFELKSFTPEEIYFNKLPVTYNPESKCSNVQAHLRAVIKEEEDVKIMQEMFGFCLIKDYPIEKSIMMFGDGRNGKSKTVELLKRFLGINNCANIPIQQLETDQYASGELINKLANISTDIGHSALKNPNMFKSLTGRDMISASRKFLNRINFTNYAKMIFCANELPPVYDNSFGFWNRWILIEFPYTFLSKEEIALVPEVERKNLKVQDPDIIDKISSEEELSGLLNWALEGLNRLLTNKSFSNSKNTEDIKNMWKRKSDSFQGFIMDELVLDYDSKITKSDLRKAYAGYCKRFKIRPIGDKSVKDGLEMLGVSDDRFRENGLQISFWEGIRFGKGEQDGMGFSTLRELRGNPRSIKTLTGLPNLTKLCQICQKSSPNYDGLVCNICFAMMPNKPIEERIYER